MALRVLKFKYTAKETCSIAFTNKTKNSDIVAVQLESKQNHKRNKKKDKKSVDGTNSIYMYY